MVSESYIDKIKTINNSFKTKNFLPFYYLYGEEEYYLLNIKLSALNNFIDDAKLNIRVYDKNNFDIDEAIEYIGNLPIFNDKKLIIFENIDYFKSRFNQKDSVKNANDKEENEFINAIEKNKDINVIIFISTETENNYNKYYKTNYLVDYVSKNGIALNLSKLNDKDTFNMVETRFKKNKVIIDKLDIAYFIKLCGSNLSNLFNEIDKIVAYVGEKKHISRQDIDVIVTKSLDVSVFILLKLYNEKKYDKALMFYGDLLSEGAYDEKSIFIIFASQFSNLIVCKDLMLKNKSAKEIADIMNIQQWRVKELIEANKYTNIDSLKTKLKNITRLTINQINGDMNEDYMLLILMNKV